MKSVTIDQSHEVMAKLATNVDWAQLDGDILQKAVKDPKGLGEQFTIFLQNGGKVVIGEVKTLPIEEDFNPEDFFGKGWKVLAEETDERGEALKELDFSRIWFKTMLCNGETSIKGEDKLRRSKEANHIRLGGKAFKACWDNRHLLAESWKRDDNGNTRYIFFDGIVLLLPDGRRYVPCLYFKDGEWRWGAGWLEYDFYANYPSAVLAS
ncbi:MAG: hypothetical protein COV70_04135 [Parcubacteria group bacterium CG11_big_fil_rev_8_21_14_0_20_39_22]|nr:MAG: hypothetical protein COV70_04135 [Parcubacteria group bacterium CG11_big_fil_rev_8_21_14_0_20_39_22]